MRNFWLIILLLWIISACESSPERGVLLPLKDEACINNLEYELDFGVVPDSISLLQRRLSIVNRSKDTVEIIRVDRSCGCTQLQLSNTVIAPDDSIFLDVKIDLGSSYSFFERDIAIYTNSRDEPFVVYVRALRRLPESSVIRDFPIKISDRLRINIPYVIIGNVVLGEVKSAHINVLNNSDSEVHYIVEMEDKPTYLNVFSENVLGPNSIGRITIMFDLSNAQNIWGLQRYRLRIIEHHKCGNSEVEIPIEAIFVDNLTKFADAPRLFVPIPYYSVDTVIKKIDFSLQNVGKSLLHIRDVQISNTIRFAISSYEIAPGQEGQLTIFNSSAQKDMIEVGVSTNDPVEPYKILRVNYLP